LEQSVFVWMRPQDFALEHLHCSTDSWVGALHLREAVTLTNSELLATSDAHYVSFTCGCDEQMSFVIFVHLVCKFALPHPPWPTWEPRMLGYQEPQLSRSIQELEELWVLCSTRFDLGEQSTGARGACLSVWLLSAFRL